MAKAHIKNQFPNGNSSLEIRWKEAYDDYYLQLDYCDTAEDAIFTIETIIKNLRIIWPKDLDTVTENIMRSKLNTEFENILLRRKEGSNLFPNDNSEIGNWWLQNKNIFFHGLVRYKKLQHFDANFPAVLEMFDKEQRLTQLSREDLIVIRAEMRQAFKKILEKRETDKKEKAKLDIEPKPPKNHRSIHDCLDQSKIDMSQFKPSDWVYCKTLKENVHMIQNMIHTRNAALSVSAFKREQETGIKITDKPGTKFGYFKHKPIIFVPFEDLTLAQIGTIENVWAEDIAESLDLMAPPKLEKKEISIREQKEIIAENKLDLKKAKYYEAFKVVGNPNIGTLPTFEISTQ